MCLIQDYQDAEHKLSLLIAQSQGNPVSGTPQWTLNNAAAMQLLIQYEIDVDFLYGEQNELIVETCDYYSHTAQVRVSEHPSKEVAVRYAIVRAAIGHLQHAASSATKAPAA